MSGVDIPDIPGRKQSADTLNTSGKIPCDRSSEDSNSLISQDITGNMLIRPRGVCVPRAAFATDSQELRRIYNAVDENGDGLLSTCEIRVFLEKLGIQMSEEDVDSVVRPLCHDGDGGLRFQEFTAWWESVQAEDGDGENNADSRELLEAFRVFDKNEDGYISSTELQQILTNLGFAQGQDLANCEKMISRFDLDSNGLLDYSEFENMMRNAVVRI